MCQPVPADPTPLLEAPVLPHDGAAAGVHMFSPTLPSLQHAGHLRAFSELTASTNNHVHCTDTCTPAATNRVAIVPALALMAIMLLARPRGAHASLTGSIEKWWSNGFGGDSSPPLACAPPFAMELQQACRAR